MYLQTVGFLSSHVEVSGGFQHLRQRRFAPRNLQQALGSDVPRKSHTGVMEIQLSRELRYCIFPQTLDEDDWVVVHPLYTPPKKKKCPKKKKLKGTI